MDYLIFLTGLFLLTAGIGCLLLPDSGRRFSRRPLLAIALATLGFKAWFGILVFAFGMGETSILVNAVLGSVVAASLLGFCLSPLVDRKRLVFILKWAAMVALFAVTFFAGLGTLMSASFLAPMLAVSFAAGWLFAPFLHSLDTRRRALPPLVTALLLTAVAVICLLPDTVATCYNVQGQGHGLPRLILLATLVTATACSLAFCLIPWATIYQASRSRLPRNLLRRRYIGTSMILAAAVFTCANGAWLTHWLGSQAQHDEASTLLSALRLGANLIPASQIEQIRGVPEEIASPPYAALRAKLLQVREALPGTRFAYLLGLRDQQLVFLVDAENPANTETFSPPGEPVKDYPAKWGPELAGQSTFQGPDRDEWGVWYAATVPILDANQQVVALLGVDYPAATWLRSLVTRRIAAMVVTLSVALLLIGLFGFHLSSIENARRVEHLSEHLSDAMIAADLDTWECFTHPFRLNVGERIATTLGWAGTHAKPSRRMVWHHLHPADRHALLKLLRPAPGEGEHSSEQEIRLQVADGRWLWFMVRGRLVRSQHHRHTTRLVGTILNIDERQRSRLELDKQRHFAQHVMEAVPSGLAVISSDGLISYANPAFIHLSRSTPTTIVGQPLAAIIANADDLAGNSQGCEAILRCLDGSSIIVQVFRAKLSQSSRDTSSILAIVDLTAAKEAEQNLLRSRAEANRLALVAKRTDNAVVITDTNGRIEWVNEGFTKISGYAKEEVIGKTPGSILQHSDDNPAERLYMRQCIQAGLGFESEIINYAKNGHSYLVHIECQPLFDQDATLTGFMAIERDVTQTRRSSKLLEAVASISTTLLAKRIDPSVWGEILAALGSAAGADRCYLFHVHPHPVLGTPAMSQSAEWNSGTASAQIHNPQLQNLPFQETGYGRWLEELLAGRQISGAVRDFPAAEHVLLTAQDIRSLVIVPIFTADQLSGFMGFDDCHQERFWENWEISILRSAAANIGLRQVVQDESDALVLARDEAHRAALTAEKANRAKSTFLATMSHEIRTPLNAVIGMASLLETTSLNVQQQDFAQTILTASNFLLELINDILDYSRIESGNIELEPAPFSLPDLCRDAFDVVRLGALGKNLELIARIAPQLPDHFLGDRARIRQILVNLLGNAVKFTPAGFVSLIVDGHQSSDEQWHLTCEINDSGIGIAPDAIARLFIPFIQEDSSTTRRFGGSGLGLAISKRLTEVMGGDISVTSIPGQGSSFRISLPLQPAAISAPTPPVFARLPDGHQLKILVVDDNEVNRRILEETLASWGLSCHTAASASLAIQLWRQTGPFDLVITDQHMPDMDGTELTRYLRTLPEAGHTRFSLLSSESHHPAEIRRIFDEVGAKPIWPSAIHSTITRLFPGSLSALTPASTSAAPTDAQPIDHLKVLVAEDNLNNQKVIRLLLRRLGIDADLVADGQQALTAAAAATQPYDIILLDLQMPVMDGLEACRRIRALNLAHRPSIIALTANAFQDNRDAASAAGMDAYLPKPITLDRLREMLIKIAAATPPPNIVHIRISPNTDEQDEHR